VRTAIVVVEDFYADPHAVRAYALAQRYYLPYQPDRVVAAGASPSWLASEFREASDCPFKSSSTLVEALEAATGERVDLDHWKRSFPTDAEGKAAPDRADGPTSCLWNCSFHVKPYRPQPAGEGVHNHVTDTWNAVGPDGWAGIVYLSPDAPLHGGLRLWWNRDRRRDLDWMTPRENWRLVDELGNVFNRLVLARGDLPHSGAAGWGDSVATGRLFQTFFFRTRASTRTAGLRVV
jgi:hypothetical protein